MGETVEGGCYLNEGGDGYHDANGNPVKGPPAEPNANVAGNTTPVQSGAVSAAAKDADAPLTVETVETFEAKTKAQGK